MTGLKDESQAGYRAALTKLVTIEVPLGFCSKFGGSSLQVCTKPPSVRFGRELLTTSISGPWLAIRVGCNGRRYLDSCILALLIKYFGKRTLRPFFGGRWPASALLGAETAIVCRQLLCVDLFDWLRESSASTLERVSASP